MDHRVAKRYARALYESAERMDIVASVEDDLTSIVRLLKDDERFRRFMMQPNQSREGKVSLAENVFSDRITALTLQALRLILQKRRENELEAIREEFVKLRRERGNVLFTTITTSEPLEESQKQALIAKLESKTGKKVEGDYRVDPNVIGGIKVAYGNYVLDGTLRNGLDRLRDKLRIDVLKQA